MSLQNRSRSLWSDAWRRILRDKVAVICLVIIGFYAALAVVAPLFFNQWEQAQNYDIRNQAPSLSHPMGTDGLGRGIVLKTVLGAHVSMSIAFWANCIAIPLGMLLGALAGYFGRRTDDLVVWFFTTLSAIPGIILLIALKFAFEGKPFLSGTTGLVIALGVTSWIGTCRLVRAETMKIKNLEYVHAARASGRGSFAILFKHVLPNVSHIGIIEFSLGFVNAIIAEVILSYLSLGVEELPSWGKMIDDARMELVVGHWWEMAAAVIATFIIVLAWNIFGDRLRDALDPRLKNVG